MRSSPYSLRCNYNSLSNTGLFELSKRKWEKVTKASSHSMLEESDYDDNLEALNLFHVNGS